MEIKNKMMKIYTFVRVEEEPTNIYLGEKKEEAI